MAIITGTAIAGATIKAGTIAAGAAFAASTAGTAVSLSKASKQKKAQQKAEDAASKALEQAREKLEVNYMKGLSIQKEPYELEREAALSGLGQIVQAGQEGEQRGAGVTAGRAAALNQAQQAQTRAAMGRELSDLEKAAAQEESRLQNLRVGLDVKEVEGQQAAAQQAAQNRAAYQSQAMQGIASMGAIAGQQIPEYLNQGDPNDPFAGVSFGQYRDEGGTMSRSEYRDTLGGGTNFGNLLSSISGGASNLFTNIFPKRDN